MSADELDDGSVVLTGGLEGSANVLGVEKSAGSSRAMVLAKINNTGTVEWIKTFGKAEGANGVDLHVGLIVRALAGGSFVVAGIHGPHFDLGAGDLVSGSRNGWGPQDGFVSIFRSDGTVVFAANLEKLALRSERASNKMEVRALSIDRDDSGGIWVLAGRDGERMVGVHVSPAGVVIGKVEYPITIHHDAIHDQLGFFSSDSSTPSLVASFEMIRQDPIGAFAIAPDGSLNVIDAAETIRSGNEPGRDIVSTKDRGLVLWRFSAGNVSSRTVINGAPEWDKGLIAIGPSSETYVAASSIRGDGVVARVNPTGEVKWKWPVNGTDRILAIGLVSDHVRAAFTHRGSLAFGQLASHAAEPSLSWPSGLTVATMALDGRLASLESVINPDACPPWRPVDFFSGAIRSRMTSVSHVSKTGNDCAESRDGGAGFAITSTALQPSLAD